MKAGWLLAALVVVAGSTHAAVPTSFEDCDRMVRDTPRDRAAYACYVTIAGRHNGWDEASRLLDSRLAVEPENALAKLALASVESRRGGERSEALYVESIDALENRGTIEETVAARLDYSMFLAFRRRNEDTAEQLRRASETAESSGNAELAAWVEVHLAQMDYYQARYEAAEQRLMAVRDVVMSDAPAARKAKWYAVAGSAHWGLGRFPEALEDYRKQAELLRWIGDTFEEAVALSNIALLTSRVLPQDNPDYNQRIVAAVERARKAASRGGNVAIEAKSDLYLGQLKTDVSEKRYHLQRGMNLSRISSELDNTLLATRLLAESLIGVEPRDIEEGMRLLDEGSEMAEAYGSLQHLARNRIVQATLLWKLLREDIDDRFDREEAMRRSWSALDGIDAIRDNQTGATTRARTFAPWAFFYSRFIGNLLWPQEIAPSAEATDTAFRVAERMRARVFLDELDASNSGRGLADLPWSELPTIEEVQQRLEDDEALLSFVSADQKSKDVFQGGSWLTWITSEATGVVRLSPRNEIAATVDLTLGSIRNRDGSERAGLERLYLDLLDTALRDIPDGVDHLIVVPDGPLHRLPFGALQDPREETPLANRYRVSQIPSAAAWLHWTADEPAQASRPAVAWVDPTLGDHGTVSDLRDRPLGRLPFAALEARALRDHLGRGVRVLSAGTASEKAFKEAALPDYGIVHLAAHAVVNDRQPDRSGVVLAGGDDEDGLLQASEIVELDLTGRTVVLSACRSASGTILEGEGVMSLARAFFVAGAEAVVANLWPVRDDEAAAFAADFYRHVGEGRALSDAMAAARRDRVAAGDPTEAWAGTVLLGNGRVSPSSEVRGRLFSWTFLPVLALLVAVAALALGIVTHRRR